MKQLSISKTIIVNNEGTLSNEHFPIVSGTKIVIWTR